ncbi:FUSC family protein [Pseudomonas aeruginosa]|nr:FUSC family protein [Pseudomonas aeruginosa]
MLLSFPSGRDWLFSARTFLAAMLALYVALALSLPHPVWAMGTVYIVSNPLIGAMRSKTVYRICGTLLGTGAAVLVVPPLSNAPELLLLVIALWSGGMLFLALLDRSPRSYLFSLPAYTMPLIAVPAVFAPQLVFDTALARSEEILVGIVCANVVAGLIFPVRATSVIGPRLDAWFKDATVWASESLAQLVVTAAPTGRHKLAADILAIDQLITHMSYDATNQDVVRITRELRVRMSMLLPHLSALANMLQRLRELPGGVHQEVQDLMEEVADWLTERPGSAIARTQLTKLEVQLAQQRPRDSWGHLLEGNLCQQLESLIALWQDCVELRSRLAQGKSLQGWQPVYRRWEIQGTAHHHDYLLLFFSVGSMSVGIFLAGLAWLYTGWAHGANALILGTVACCMFAAQDEPWQMMRKFFRVLLVCSVVAGVLLFVVLPEAHEFETLALYICIPFLLAGTQITKPQFSSLAMLLVVFTAGFVGIQGTYTADFAAFVNSSLAGATGVLVAMIWTLITRPFGTALALHRLINSSWADLSHTARGLRSNDYAQHIARMHDRLAQILPRLAVASGGGLTDGFRELRVGFCVLSLQRKGRRIPGTAGQVIDDVLKSISVHFRECSNAGRYVAPSLSLLKGIDSALSVVIDTDGAPARKASNALVELRATLYPEASAFMAEGVYEGRGSSNDR